MLSAAEPGQHRTFLERICDGIAEELPGASLQIICDRDSARAQEIATTYGAVDIESDGEKAIARDDVDAVIVASPDFTHAPLSMACIRAGKKVLCEKPLSQSSAECIEVMKTEQKAGAKFIQLGFMRRLSKEIFSAFRS